MRNTYLFGWEISSPRSIAIVFLPRDPLLFLPKGETAGAHTAHGAGPSAPRSPTSSRLVRRRTATAACVSKRHASDSISSGRRGEQH